MKVDLKNCSIDAKYKIYFENDIIKQSFDRLLRYECTECLKTSGKKPKSEKNNNDANITSGNSSTTSNSVSNPTFDRRSKVSNNIVFQDVFNLKNHLHFVHKLKLCDLCLNHDKLFPFEYSYYDFNALKKHMKEGEPKTSHRGHPECELCHDTFFNKDELLGHMGREHFHCHICARQDSNLRYYFLDYASLRKHFKKNHFLCERGQCRVEQFTSAFENYFEYQMHMVQVHGSQATNVSRGESRQQRTIMLEPAPHRQPRTNSPNRTTRSRDPNIAVVSTGVMAMANDPQRHRLPESFLSQLREQRLPSRNEFPALGQTSTTTSHSSRSPQPNFPALASTRPHINQQPTSSASLSQRINSPGTSSHSFVSTLGGGIRSASQLNESDFPPLPEQPKPKGANIRKSQAKMNSCNSRGGMSLDQLIRTSLAIGPSNSRTNKNVKQKPLRIQLS